MNRRDLIKTAAGATGLAIPFTSAKSASHRRAQERTILRWTQNSESLRLSMTRQPSDGPVVLYVHGATFPTALSVGWRMDGVSWLDHLQANGFDAWALDFAGYGQSERPAAFEREAAVGSAYGDHFDRALVGHVARAIGRN
jgi:pimeloyl-ACP methyl ester carboxylesterase